MVDQVMYEASKVFSSTVLNAFTNNSSMRHFSQLQMNEGGNKYVRRYAEVLGEPEIMEVIAEQLAHFGIKDGMYQLPVLPWRVEIKPDEYELYVKMNAMPPNIEAAGIDLARAFEKRMWQGPPATGPGSEMLTKYYGIKDGGTGNGTYSRPLICTAVTTAEDWEDSGMVDIDLGKLLGNQEALGFNAPFGFFAPQSSADLFRYPYKPSSTSVSGSIKARIESEPGIAFFEYIGNDINGYCLMTGAAETSDGAAGGTQVIVLAMQYWILVIKTPLKTKLWYSEKDYMYYFDMELQGVIVPICKKTAAGKVYKGACSCDSIDLAD